MSFFSESANIEAIGKIDRKIRFDTPVILIFR